LALEEFEPDNSQDQQDEYNDNCICDEVIALDAKDCKKDGKRI
jgi:hypothetical protein